MKTFTTQAVNYLQKYRTTILHPDQAALNAVRCDKVAEVDLGWNVQIGAIRFFERTGWPEDREFLRRRTAQLLSEAKIVHFIGPSKPWEDGLLMPYVREYRKVIVESGWIPKWRKGPSLVSWFSRCRKALRRRFRKSGKAVVKSAPLT